VGRPGIFSGERPGISDDLWWGICGGKTRDLWWGKTWDLW